MASNGARLLLHLPIQTLGQHYRTAKLFTGIVRILAPNLILSSCRYFSEQNENSHVVADENDNFESVEMGNIEADLESIAEGNTETLRQLKLFLLEMHSRVHVPSKITESVLRELLLLPSKTQRAKYIYRLCKKEYRVIDTKCMKAEKRKILEERKSNNPIKTTKLETNSPIKYGLMDNTLFDRFYPKKMKNVGNYRLLQAMMFGPDIIIDCGYEDYMSRQELSIFSRQLRDTWALNRERLNPFNIIFCNLSTKSYTYTKLCKLLPSIEEDPAFPFNHTETSYLDLFSRSQLVYLSPNSSNMMEKYDGNKVYIIGGLVDVGYQQRMSLAKAKRDNICTATFPINKYIKWTEGTKTLHLPECMTVMNTVKDRKEWVTAFSHVESQRKKNFKTSLLQDVDEEKTC